MKTIRLIYFTFLMLLIPFAGVKAEKILFLTNVTVPVSVNDTSIVNSLTRLGYTVVSKRSQDFTTADLTGTHCIFISEAIGSADPANLYTAENANQVQIPIICAEPYAYSVGRLPMMELTNSAAPPTGYGAGTTIYGKIWITEAGAQHPIGQKAGFTTAITSNDDAIEVLVNSPGMALVNATTISEGKGVIVAHTGQTHQAVIVAIEKGTVVVTGKPLQARRVHFFPRGGMLTSNGVALLKATVEWCIEGLTTSVKETNSEGMNVLFAGNKLNINEENATVEMYRIDGQLYSKSANVSVFDCSSMPKGMYMARITSGKKMQTTKIVVK
jgi:hypothetical protein